MARFRLRYQSTDLEMPIGEFVVGRSSSCSLAVDDALVSRRHAVFHVTAEGVEVEDPGSRNGVIVNGAQIEGRRPLKHLDRVEIGAQELLLVRVQEEETRAERGARPTLAGMTLDLPVLRAEEPDEPTIHRSESVLDRIADKALALGRYDEAERMLGRKLKDLLLEAQEGRSSPRRSSSRPRATRCASPRARARGVARLDLRDPRRDRAPARRGRHRAPARAGAAHPLSGRQGAQELHRAHAAPRRHVHAQPALLAAAPRGHRARRRRLTDHCAGALASTGAPGVSSGG
ncbi:MAG: FHA domain-containing protein [Sandaracinaceae bacterium]|nr:FHA domain-containing protein [Sandaracinaceae bacterium]